MVKIIDGKKLAEKIKDEIVKEIIELNHGRPENCLVRPNLAIILVGEREDSKIYVARKERAAKEVGIDTHFSAITFTRRSRYRHNHNVH